MPRRLAARDETIAKGGWGFFKEAAYNLAKIVQDAARMVQAAAEHQVLPAIPKEALPRIRVETPGGAASRGAADGSETQPDEEREEFLLC